MKYTVTKLFMIEHLMSNTIGVYFFATSVPNFPPSSINVTFYKEVFVYAFLGEAIR